MVIDLYRKQRTNSKTQERQLVLIKTAKENKKNIHSRKDNGLYCQLRIIKNIFVMLSMI